MDCLFTVDCRQHAGLWRELDKAVYHFESLVDLVLQMVGGKEEEFRYVGLANLERTY